MNYIYEIDMERIDLNLLVVFEALVREGSVTRAGESLGLSQPAVSAALGRLRDIFDDRLFIRSNRGMVPTQRAQELIEPVGKALLIIHDILQKRSQFDPASSLRRFNILMMDVGEVEFLPKLLQHVTGMGSGICISTTPPARVNGENPIAAFETGEVDLALGYWPQFSERRGFQRQRLFTDSFVCMVRSDHPEIGNDMTIEQFASVSHLVIMTHGNTDGVIEQTLSQQGLTRNIVARVPHFLAVPAIIMNSDLLVTVPERLATDYSKSHPFRLVTPPFSIPTFDVSQYWHRRFGQDPGLKWLIETIFGLFAETMSKGRGLRSQKNT